MNTNLRIAFLTTVIVGLAAGCAPAAPEPVSTPPALQSHPTISASTSQPTLVAPTGLPTVPLEVTASAGSALLPATCNPSWRSPRSLNLDIAHSPDHAREILNAELRRWTRVVHLPDTEQRWVQVYLTYMSPQMIEAVVVDKAAREGLSLEESRDLLAEFDRRLRTKNSIPFLVTVRGLSEYHLWVTFGPLDQTIVMVNQRHQEIPPLAEYTSALAEPINMGGGGLEGYVLFPRSVGVGEGCNPTVDLLSDHSFDIRLRQIRIESDWWEGDYEGLWALWPYTLLPSIPLEQAKDIPPPQRTAADIDASVLFDILGLALGLFELLLAVP